MAEDTYCNPYAEQDVPALQDEERNITNVEAEERKPQPP
jgi:hypothetical protein